jgi:Uma2 family endonuclease
MIAAIERPVAPELIVCPQINSLDEWLTNPPDGTEWVNGQLVEKNGMNLKTGRVVARLSRYWGDYKDASGQGGEVYVETPCRTKEQGRRPDIAYLPADLATQYGDLNTLPQSFPLIAEIVSPTDEAEAVFSKATEYLQSGCLEVWLVLPVSGWIAVITSQQKLLFTAGDMVTTQVMLPGFSLSVDELFG